MDTTERFWRHVDRRSPQECWNWVGRTFSGGYGVFWLDGKNRRAHRVSFELFNGAITDGAFVLHGCDNRRCVNPSHLRLGDHKDNARDAVERDRMVNYYGEEHPNALRTEAQAREVWQLRARGWPESAIATTMAVPRTWVNSVLSGHTWGHITPETFKHFVCPCGRSTSRGKTSHYGACRKWQEWAATHEPVLLALVLGVKRSDSERLQRAYELVTSLHLQAADHPLFSDVIGAAEALAAGGGR